MTIKKIQGYTIYMKKFLGSGSFGEVYIAEQDISKKLVAVKIILKDLVLNNQNMRKALFQQINIMKSINNPNTVQLIDVLESITKIYIIQELCDQDLSKFIKKNKQISQDDCINILTQICNGFLVLVKQGIIHRDLKPANIMIKNNIFKIGDFGFAKKIPNQDFKNKTYLGTLLYMPLQILKKQLYTSKCDIWALGVIFYELLHGQVPWVAQNEFKLIQNISNIPLSIKRKDLKKSTVDFIKKCLQINQQDRISWDEIFLHPIFNGFFHNEGTNKRFQNKLKQILGELRYYITSNNLDLSQIISNFGYENRNRQLDFQAFCQFLKAINPTISKHQALYIFKETDIDTSGTISVIQIQQILQKYNIFFTSKMEISEKIQNKVQKFFQKLHQCVTKSNKTLEQIFYDFNKQHDGRLTYNQFNRMMTSLDKTMQEDEILEAFNLIDEDQSKQIQFHEFNKYY